ncbi:hypothetical protein F5B20DRAFT_416794 [Whalleya microplaca]|nr:hypothetical protein F5B20DRAFT_416794 [Whalleya microplaca]
MNQKDMLLCWPLVKPVFPGYGLGLADVTLELTTRNRGGANARQDSRQLILTQRQDTSRPDRNAPPHELRSPNLRTWGSNRHRMSDWQGWADLMMTGKRDENLGKGDCITQCGSKRSLDQQSIERFYLVPLVGLVGVSGWWLLDCFIRGWSGTARGGWPEAGEWSRMAHAWLTDGPIRTPLLAKDEDPTRPNAACNTRDWPIGR